jgi:transcriptional regulator of aromatic amino acid metabolism
LFLEADQFGRQESPAPDSQPGGNVASLQNNIKRVVTNSKDGTVSAPHHNIMAKLKLTGVNRQRFDAALDEINGNGFTVEKTETHTTISVAG